MSNRNSGTLAYTVFAFRAVYIVQSISITSIVRLKCNGLNPIMQKCFGTYILPNALITTSLCAESCQYAENMPVLQKFIHQHYKNYVPVKGLLQRNDIALLRTNATKRKIAQMSFLDQESPLGLKAFVPIMSENGPKLQVAVIQRCIETLNRLVGYYVCTNNVMTEEAIRICNKEEQGIPLLLDDKIYGIMSLRAKDNCIIPQRRFTAIGPALSWISSTAENLDEEYQTLKMHAKADRKNVLRQYISALTENNVALDQTSSENITSSAENDQDKALHANEEERINRNKEIRNMLAYFTTSGPLDPTDQHQLKPFSENVKQILRGGSIKPPSTASTTPTVVPPLRPFGATAITFKPRLRARSLRKKTQMTPSTIKTTTTHVIPFVKDLGNNRTTNVMDWFRNELKRVENRSLYLVLSTTTSAKPVFVDLT